MDKFMSCDLCPKPNFYKPEQVALVGDLAVCAPCLEEWLSRPVC